MPIQINHDGGIVISDCRLFRAGIMEASGHELGLTGEDKRKWFSTYYPPQVLSDARFLKGFERLPIILGHLNAIEARHYEGTASAARFDGEWVIADLAITTVAALTEIFVHRVTDLSTATTGVAEKIEGSVWDDATSGECDFSYMWNGLTAKHIALVPIGRVPGAELNL